MATNAPEKYHIPECSWRRAQWRPSDRIKIGWTVVEKSTIEFWITSVLGFLQATLKKVGDLHEYWCAREVPYTVV